MYLLLVNVWRSSGGDGQEGASGSKLNARNAFDALVTVAAWHNCMARPNCSSAALSIVLF